MPASYDNEDRSVVEFQLGNKQLFMLFLGLLVICAIFFFIGLRVGEDTARSRVPFDLSDANNQGQTPSQTAENTSKLAEQSLEVQPAAQPPVTETPTAKQQKQEPDRDNSRPAQQEKKAVTQPATETRAADKPVTQQPAAGSGNHYVQVAAPTDEQSAEKVRARLASSFPVRVVKVNVGGKDHFRVLLGPYPSKDAAEEVRQAVLSSFKGAFIQVVN